MWVWRTDRATSPRPIITKREMKALANQGALDWVHSKAAIGNAIPHQKMVKNQMAPTEVPEAPFANKLVGDEPG